MRILRRPRSEQDLAQLIEEVNKSRYIGELSDADMEGLIEVGTIRFFYDDDRDELVGFGAWENIGDDWVELGPFFTRRQFRGRGAGRTIISMILDMNVHRNLFAVSKNKIVRRIFVRKGFSTVSLFDLPRAVILHQLRRMTLRRLWKLITKFRFERMYFLVRPQPQQHDQSEPGQTEGGDPGYSA